MKKRIVLFYFSIGVLILSASFGTWWVARSLRVSLEMGVESLFDAVQAFQHGDQKTLNQALAQARSSFVRGERWLLFFRLLPDIALHIPGIRVGIAGEALFRSGREGVDAAPAALSLVSSALGSLPSVENHDDSLITILHTNEKNAADVLNQFTTIESTLRRVSPQALPVEYRERFLKAQRGVSLTRSLFFGYVQHQPLFEELLGAYGPRTYLFLFQNNQELRATGGFIGTYALLEMSHGHRRRFFVDGIFNPDGHLSENIVPPEPIQKISAGWSLHDSNWFPDFPLSAQKAMFFYEKSGGPTIDGIITLTPTVLQRLLEITGPVDLPEYGVTIDANNFLPIIQEEVEVNYDKEVNEPKRILGDLTEALIDRFLTFRNPRETWKLGNTLAELLNERHILLYARSPEVEELIRTAGWSGELLSPPHDYLSVVHSNINGFKTDGVIDSVIEHTAVIESDGRIIDTVTITRSHHGGTTPYDWWNRVNTDYLRVYVPKGSKLLSASGMTREFPTPPLDYDALKFRRDPDVVQEESGTTIDSESGTRISEESGKMVLGNWVYVSPGESVKVTYTYELPFRVNPSVNDPASYSILYQKQSGTERTELNAHLQFPENDEVVWQTPENLVPYDHVYGLEKPFLTDQYWGFVFRQRSS